MAFVTHLYLCGFLLAGTLPVLLSQQCQVVVTSEDVIRREVASALENITEQIRCLKDQVNRLNPVGSELNPATSCVSLLQHPASPSGYYWVRASNGSAVRVYCDMTRSCGGVTGGWMRVAELNMTDSSEHCPSGLRQRTDSSIRTCVSSNQNSACSSIYFNIQSLEHSKVCGMIRAYQIGSPGAFYRGEISNPTIEQNYVDGVSLTHGHPRQHIWTFAAAPDEIGNHRNSCPCITNIASQPPTFIGNDYFCDTASRIRFIDGHFYIDNPLWDGAGCGPVNTCCSFNSPPWFYKQLPQPTTDDIEMRVCRDEGAHNEDVAIEAFEIYVQ